MSLLELQRVPDALSGPAAVVVPAPGRLRNGVRPRRGLLQELFDLATVPLNRLLGGIGAMRRLREASLRRLEVTHVPLRVDRRHAGLAGLRIAFLSDLHAGAFGGRDELRALFARALALRPDVVCLGGDLINSRPVELGLYDGPLQELKAPLGVYAVAGNHDHRWFPDMGAWQDFLQARGVRVLANCGARLSHGGASLWLGGVDDLTDGRPDVRRALWGRAPGEPTVMLAHQPDHFPELATHGVDLVLSGHTHGGQIKVLGRAVIAHTAHRFVEGEHRVEGHPGRLWVSRGCGVTLLPIRVGSRCEITLVRIESSP
ncbi:MAG: metallophosphoesterase [Planctomycetes bacterium]|nr:metallophosphoesterase [Planctomycetota bacterium]